MRRFGVAELLPNRRQARDLVVSLALFWGSWGVAAVGFGTRIAVLGGVGVLVALVFGFRFYLALYGVWEPESGEPAWRMMFVPSFSRRRAGAQRHLFDLFRPTWIKHTLRETGWNPSRVGYGLAALVVADLVLAFVVLPWAASN